tara:strand:+ start:123 stop:539 length:417 start_codon:yes stop_codon:yes gene_type:complete
MTTYYKQYETTFLSKLPEDILDYIWSMNHEWAANIMQHAVRSFIRIKVIEFRKMIDFACWPCDFGAEMKTYNLFYKNRILNRQDVLNTLSACKCCERHQKNKPSVLSKWEDTTIPSSQYTPCKCSCRHLSRWICRGAE